MERFRRYVPILLATVLLWMSSLTSAMAGPILLNPNFQTGRACACFPCPTHYCYRCSPGCTTQGWQPNIHGGFCPVKIKCKLFSTSVCNTNNPCGTETVSGPTLNKLESTSKYTGSGATRFGCAFLDVEQCITGLTVGDVETVHFTACNFSVQGNDAGGNTEANVGVKFCFCCRAFCFQHGAGQIDNNAICCGGICTPGTLCNFSFVFKATKTTQKVFFIESASTLAGGAGTDDPIAFITGGHITITQASGTPEIDARAMTAPIAALLGVLLILAERRLVHGRPS